MAREALEGSEDFSGITRAHFFEGEVHSEALARLEHLAESGFRCGIVVGPRGTGKSTVLRVFAAERRAAGHETIMIDVTGLNGLQFLERLVHRLQVTSRARGRLTRLWTEANDALAGRALAAHRSVLIVDHLDRSVADCQSLIQRLALGGGTRRSEAWILALSGRSFPCVRRELREYNDLRIELGPLTQPESHAFLHSLLDFLSRPHDVLDAAAAALVAAAGGIPAALRRAGELSLLVADGHQARVSPAALEAVLQELRGLRFTA